MALTQRLLSDVFRDMQRAMSALEQPLLSLSLPRGGARYPPTDIVEHEDSYELQAELPGYNKKDIKIEVADDQRTLVISGCINEVRECKSEECDIKEYGHEKKEGEKKEGEKKEAKKEESSKEVAKKEKKTPQWWVNERVTGSFSRAFSFPHPLKPEAIKASFENGVLKVVVPKTTDAQEPKQINIE